MKKNLTIAILILAVFSYEAVAKTVAKPTKDVKKVVKTQNAKSKITTAAVTTTATTIVPRKIELIQVKKNGLWGYADLAGNIIITPKFMEVTKFSEGLAVVKDFDSDSVSNKYGVINEKGEYIVKAKYDFISNFKDGKAIFKIPVGTTWKYGYFDNKGNILVNGIFEEAMPFSNNFAAVKIEGKYGYIGNDGRVKVKPKFDKGFEFKNGIARVKIGDKFSYINEKGELLKDVLYENGNDFSEGVAAVKFEGEYGYIGKTGEFVIKPYFDMAYNFSEGMAVVKKNGLYGYINTKGDIVVETKYDYGYDFKEGTALVELGKKYSFLKKDGTKNFDVVCDEVWSFSNETARIKVKGKYGFIDNTGKVIVEPKYDKAEEFVGTIAKVEIEKKSIFIDKTGKMYLFGDYELESAKGVTVEDVLNIKQDAIAYADKNKFTDNTVSASYQKLLSDYFDQMYFSPWHKSKADFSLKSFQSIFDGFAKNPGFGENKLKHDENWIKELRENAAEESYPAMATRAITVKNTNLRLLPTNRPHFNDFSLAGEGFPFDNLQNSALAANSPVFIIHKTKDSSWYFVESAFCEGWLPADDLAFVDDGFIKTWESGKYVTIVEDEVPIADEEGIFRMKCNIGAMFPKLLEYEDGFVVNIAIPDQYKKAMLKKSKLSKGDAVSKPLEMSQKNIAGLINKLLNKSYGWGGMYDDRDCSSTLKDLFTPFGLWLPRNSGEQAKNGIFISLKNLKPEDKEKMIMDNGVPYLTLIWIKGHIMLYIGNNDGRALIFHNIWGIKTKDMYGQEGRKIIGGSVITTLEPGKELPEAYSSILSRVEGITVLVPPMRIQKVLSVVKDR